MKKLTSGIVTLMLALWLPPTGLALAEGAEINALDVNQGSGVQTNADDWYEISAALAGSGTQSSNIDGEANTGSGSQNNSEASSDAWHDISNANIGTGTQVTESSNSNGGDRVSDDIVLGASLDSTVGNAALEATVSGNSVAVDGAGSAASSEMSISDGSQFHGLSGVSAVAMGSGSNASQNVGVNVTATVSAAGN